MRHKNRSNFPKIHFKNKRLLACVLAVSMIFSNLPVSAVESVADASSSSTQVAQVGESSSVAIGNGDSSLPTSSETPGEGSTQPTGSATPSDDDTQPTDSATPGEDDTQPTGSATPGEADPETGGRAAHEEEEKQARAEEPTSELQSRS
uniref:hypothetical protein n=1 Tax=uncultured Allofournierella sp. TaxID=1940258 RepID=UPI003752CD0E